MKQKRMIPISHMVHKQITVEVPGSKSITNRALLLAALADGKSELDGALFSDDSKQFLKCLQDLGFDTMVSEAQKNITVLGLGGEVPRERASIYVGSTGTAARFLTTYLGCSKGTYLVEASKQMQNRPIKALLTALERVGARIKYTKSPDHFPIEIEGNGIQNFELTINIDESSQFLSALLLSSVLSKEDIHLHMEGTHGMEYVHMTIKMMEQFGVRVQVLSENELVVPKGQTYQARQYDIEPDASSACYFWAMAAVLGISVTVRGLHFNSLQGDVKFMNILEEMGCTIEEDERGITVTGPKEGKLKGITIDMHACSDQAITLAAIAPFADGPVRITGISHIRLQESDRIAGIVTNLNAMGIEAYEEADGVTIYPGEVKPAEIQTYDDHRLAMGFAITGLRAEGITILNPMCCKKTFEQYFEVLEQAKEQLWQ